MSKKQVLVIGAGPAGISFADKLIELSDEFSITIIEKSQYIGGISKTVNFEGNRIDIGGHRFFSKSDEVMHWWAQKFPVLIEDNSQNIELKYHMIKEIYYFVLIFFQKSKGRLFSIYMVILATKNILKNVFLL